MAIRKSATCSTRLPGRRKRRAADEYFSFTTAMPWASDIAACLIRQGKVTLSQGSVTETDIFRIGLLSIQGCLAMEICSPGSFPWLHWHRQASKRDILAHSRNPIAPADRLAHVFRSPRLQPPFRVYARG